MNPICSNIFYIIEQYSFNINIVRLLASFYLQYKIVILCTAVKLECKSYYQKINLSFRFFKFYLHENKRKSLFWTKLQMQSHTKLKIAKIWIIPDEIMFWGTIDLINFCLLLPYLINHATCEWNSKKKNIGTLSEINKHTYSVFGTIRRA